MIGNAKEHRYEQSTSHQILDEIIPSTFGSARNSEKCECFIPQRSQTIEEFKSVQSLKQFWINAFGGGANSKPQTVKCLSKNCSLKKEKSATLNGTVTRRTKETKEKSLSLNRNFQLSEESSYCGSVSSLVQKRLSDNFYKYKTADLVKSNKFCDRSYSLDIIKSTDNLTETRTSIFSEYFSCENVQSNGDNQLTECDSSSTVDDNNSKMLVPTTDNSQDFIDSTTMRETDKKERDKMTITTKQSATTVDKIPLSPSCSKSTNSSTNSLCSDSPRKASNQTRKCSFRTNSFQYHRKMTSNGGTVAALTHRFNRLVQSDSEILEEVKRNKEVIIHRAGGHVFKIKEGETIVKKKSVKKVDSSEASPQKSGKKKLSVKRKTSVKAHPVSVKDAIQLFEPSVGTIDESVQTVKREKPKVPDKSPQVLLRTREIVIRKNLFNKPPPVPDSPIPDMDKQIVLDEIKECNEVELKRVDSMDKTDNIVPSTLDVEDKIHPKLERVDLMNKTDSIVPSTLTVEETTHPTNGAVDQNSEEMQEVREKPTKVYKRIYSKFRFKSPFINQKRSESTIEPSLQDITNSINEEREVNNTRLDLFSRSEHCLSWEDEKNYQKMARDMKPNKSFLFSNPPSEQSTKVVEAINPFVLNKTRSMDETRFRSTCLMTQVSLDERGFHSILRETDELLSLIKGKAKEEDDYEIIKHPDDEIEDKKAVETPESPDLIASFVHVEHKKVNNSLTVTDETNDSSSIYQSISEARSGHHKDNDCDSVTSYESFENYESVDELLLEKNKQENGYEICSSPPEPPPPRKNDTSTESSTTTPALPVPKRNPNHFNDLQKSESSSSNYEKIKYDKAPPRPPKSPCLYKTDDRSVISNVCDVNEHDYEENIYDTIKNMDANSVTGYESITSTNGFLRTRMLKHSDSGSTMSSDQKTNSLYGTVAGRQSITPPSEGGSENSDEWMDISDGEDDRKHKFVV